MNILVKTSKSIQPQILLPPLLNIYHRREFALYNIAVKDDDNIELEREKVKG